MFETIFASISSLLATPSQLGLLCIGALIGLFVGTLPGSMPP